MWRFGIAAILLLVLVVAVADMYFGELRSAFSPGSRHPFSLNFEGFAGPDAAGLGPGATSQWASDSLAITRDSRVQDLINSQGRSFVDDIPRRDGDIPTALPGARDPYIEAPSPTYRRAREGAMWPKPVARPSAVPPSARDSFGGERVNLPARHRCGMTETPWGQLARLPNVGSRIFRGGSSLSVMIQDHWTGDWAGVRGLRYANSSEMHECPPTDGSTIGCWGDSKAKRARVCSRANRNYDRSPRPRRTRARLRNEACSAQSSAACSAFLGATSTACASLPS